MVRGWNWMIFKVTSNPKHSTILGSHEGTKLHKGLPTPLPLGGSAACKSQNNTQHGPGAVRDTRTRPHIPPCAHFLSHIPQPLHSPRLGSGLLTPPWDKQGRKEACARHYSKEVPGLVYFPSALVLPGHGRGSGGRNAGTVTLHMLPGALLLHAVMGNTAGSGVFGRGGWYTMFKHGFTLVLQPTAPLSFGQLLSSQQVFRVSLLFSSLVHLGLPLLGKHPGKPSCKESVGLEVSLACF